MLTLNEQLIVAVKEGDVSEVSRLLDKGAYIETKDNTATKAPPLVWAAYFGHQQLMELLLKRHAALDGADVHGNTALHWALRQGHEAITALLLQYGADKTLKNNNQLTPIEFAYIYQKKTIHRLSNKIDEMKDLLEQLTKRLEKIEVSPVNDTEATTVISEPRLNNSGFFSS